MDGISTCDNCCRVFDSSLYHRTLSASWIARKWHVEDADTLEYKFGFLPEEIKLVCEHVVEKGCSHEEFVKILDDSVRIDRSA